MSMYCFQCQEAAKGVACNFSKGVCGKDERTSDLMDLLIYVLRGQAFYAENIDGNIDRKYGIFMIQALFATITNANFDEDRIADCRVVFFQAPVLFLSVHCSLKNECR